MAVEMEKNQGGRRERLGFLLVFILTAIAISSSVFIIFMPQGSGSWYWESGVIYAVSASNLILVAVTITLQSVLVRKPSPIVSAAPMLGLEIAQIWMVLHYAQVILPFNLVSHFFGVLLLSLLFLLLLGVVGYAYLSTRIVGRNNSASTRKWLSIMPFTCFLGLSVAALLRGLIFSDVDEPILSIPAAILWGALAVVVLVLFAVRGRSQMTLEAGRTYSQLLMVSVISTPIVMAILMLFPKSVLFTLLWGQTMFILQFAVASANMDRLIRLPWGKRAVKVALVEGFMALPLWMLLIIAVFPNIFVQ